MHHALVRACPTHRPTRQRRQGCYVSYAAVDAGAYDSAPPCLREGFVVPSAAQFLQPDNQQGAVLDRRDTRRVKRRRRPFGFAGHDQTGHGRWVSADAVRDIAQN